MNPNRKTYKVTLEIDYEAFKNYRNYTLDKENIIELVNDAINLAFDSERDSRYKNPITRAECVVEGGEDET